MVTPTFLNPRIRDQVLSSTDPLYVAMSPRDLVYVGHIGYRSSKVWPALRIDAAAPLVIEYDEAH